jgi:hypothetical protein
MRYLMIVKANKDSEAGIMPSEKDLLEMGKFNEEMANAGMMLDGTGLEASSKGARVYFSGGTPTVEKGPFANTEELIAGYWVVKADSLDHVLGWAKRVPFVDGQIEIRRLFEMEDFAPGEAIEKAKELGKELERKKAESVPA